MISYLAKLNMMRFKLCQLKSHLLDQYLLFANDIDVAVLYLCLEECICRFGFCYLHQNRFPGRNLCYIEDIVFLDADVNALLSHKLLITPL